MTDTLRRYVWGPQGMTALAPNITFGASIQVYVEAADVERVVGELEANKAVAVALQRDLAAQEASLAQVRARVEELEGKR